MRIEGLLSAEDVIRLASVEKNTLISVLSRHAAARLGLDGTAIGRALSDREALGSTAIGNGIALPHARLPDIRQPYGLFASLGKPVEFGALDDRPVDLVFLLLLPPGGQEEGLKCLACVARRLREPGVTTAIRNATTPSRIYDLLVGGTASA